MKNIQLNIIVKKNNIDLVTEVLYALGAISIDYSSANDEQIFDSNNKILLWEIMNLKALFAVNADKQNIINILKKNLNITQFNFEKIANKNWQNECIKNFKPMLFGKNLWVTTSWTNNAKLSGVIIKIDPALAFGSGKHNTTALCLTYLANNNLINSQIVDYGCGSGILSIAAKKLGAKKVIAIDNDKQAIITTAKNAIDNNVEITTIYNKHKEQLITADLLIANILSNTIISLVEHFAQILTKNTCLVLSGILTTQKDKVITAYNKYFTNFKTIQQNQWLLITATRK